MRVSFNENEQTKEPERFSHFITHLSLALIARPPESHCALPATSDQGICNINGHIAGDRETDPFKTA